MTIEHALRCSEVVSLNIECFNLAEGTMIFYCEKTDRTETHSLKRHTRLAAETYLTILAERGCTQGPLFTGYGNRRISARAINARIGKLGKQIGVKKLLPHDLRHFWSHDALRNKTPLDRVIAGGGWSSPEMALRYARKQGIANEGVNITEER